MSGTVLQTERLVLSPLVAGDAADVYAYRSEPDIARFQSWVPATLGDVEAFVAAAEGVEFDTPGTWTQLGIRVRESGRLAGDIGIQVPQDAPRQVEVGITLSRPFQGRGMALEAMTAVLGHLFDQRGKHRVFASVDPRNAPSMALFERVGMREEAHFRESLWFKGEWADDVVFAILESEWRSGRKGESR